MAYDSPVEISQSENAGNNANGSKGFDYLMMSNVIPDQRIVKILRNCEERAKQGGVEMGCVIGCKAGGGSAKTVLTHLFE